MYDDSKGVLILVLISRRQFSLLTSLVNFHTVCTAQRSLDQRESLWLNLHAENRIKFSVGSVKDIKHKISQLLMSLKKWHIFLGSSEYVYHIATMNLHSLHHHYCHTFHDPGLYHVFHSNGKMWTCSGTRRITVASKRSESPPLTFGGLIWFSTTSMSSGYIWSMPRPFLSKILSFFITMGLNLTWSIPTSRDNQHTCQQCFELHFPMLQYWFCESSNFVRLNLALALMPLLPPHTICCIPPPWQPHTNHNILCQPECWLAGAVQQQQQQQPPLLRHWCPPTLTFNLLPPHVDASCACLCPQCRRWLCHCSWDQSAAGVHRTDHMEPTCHFQELLWDHCAAFPLWPAELQHEAGHLDLWWKLGRHQSCNSTETIYLKGIVMNFGETHKAHDWCQSQLD